MSSVCAKIGAKIFMNTEIEKRIGKNIKVLRESAGITQDLLAVKLQLSGCDITRSAVAKIEVGQRHIYVVELKAFRDILNVSFEQLLP